MKVAHVFPLTFSAWEYLIILQGLCIPYYYIDTSVLLENIPLVKFIKTTSGTRAVYFP